MDKYFKNSFSFKLIHFVLPKINHSKLFSIMQDKKLCLSMIHEKNILHLFYICFTFVLQKSNRKEIIMNTNKLISKIMKIGSSNGVVLGKEVCFLLGRKVNVNEQIIIKKTKRNTLEISFLALDEGLINE